MAVITNVKSASHYGFGGAHYMKHPTPGDVFYVTDATRGGDNANNGLSPATPFLTITYALTQLTGLRDSYIFVQRTTRTEETWPITIDQAYLHPIGTMDQASPTPIIFPDDNNHGFVLAAGGVEIAGFLFQNTVGNQKAGIYAAAAQQWMNHYHHNWFAWDGDCYDCILLENQQVQTAITDSYFGVHGFSNYAIHATAGGGCGRIRIERNVFFQQGRITTGVKAILLNFNFGGVIKDNVFRCRDNAAGEAITVSGQNGLITGNYAMSGVAANMTNNPYQEDGTSHWGLNYDNQTARLPA